MNRIHSTFSREKETITFCCRRCLEKETTAQIRRSHRQAAVNLFVWLINCHALYYDRTVWSWMPLSMTLLMAWLMWREVSLRLWPLYFIRSLYRRMPESAVDLTFRVTHE